jgi:Outer membrane lipoprotein
MMRDPERLLSPASDADELERELLAGAGSVAPPAHARDEVWRKLTPQIAAAAAATGSLAAGSAAAKAGVFGSLAPKTLAAKLAWSVAAGGLVVSGYFVQQRLSAPEPTAAPSRPAAPAPRVEPARAQVEDEAAQAPCTGDRANEPPCVANTAPARAKRPEPAANSDRLRAESALLAAARAELRGGDPAAAQRTLERLATRFPRGVLHQERDVLAIEVLAARGEREAAARRAATFIRAYPESPHRDKVQGFLAPR